MAATYVKPQTVSAFYGAPKPDAGRAAFLEASQKTAKLDHEVTRWWRAA